MNESICQHCGGVGHVCVDGVPHNYVEGIGADGEWMKVPTTIQQPSAARQHVSDAALSAFELDGLPAMQWDFEDTHRRHGTIVVTVDEWEARQDGEVMRARADYFKSLAESEIRRAEIALARVEQLQHDLMSRDRDIDELRKELRAKWDQTARLAKEAWPSNPGISPAIGTGVYGMLTTQKLTDPRFGKG